MAVKDSVAALTRAINNTTKEFLVTQASLNTKVTAIQANQTTAATQKTTAEGYRDTAATNATSAAASLATVKSTVVMDGIPAISGSKVGTALDTFIYDTSLDSDGGAWRKRCQHTSWFNETTTGKWLGAHVSEFEARHSGATLSVTNLVTNGTFAGGTTGWENITATLSVVDGEGVINGSASGYVRQSITTVVGKTYQVTCSARRGTTSTASISLGGVYASTTSPTATTLSCVYTATGTSALLWLQVSSAGTAYYDNISVREVTALTTASNDYFQLTTDGKFYRLWKNQLQWSEDFTNGVWGRQGTITIDSNTHIAPNGTLTADTITNTVGNEISTNIITVSGLAYTASISIKKTVGATVFPMVALNGASVFGQVILNTNTGVATVRTGVSGATNVVVVDQVDYWRVSFSFVTDTASSNLVYYAGASTNGASYASGLVGSQVIWGAQVELGSIVTAYELKVAVRSTSEVFRGNRREFPAVALIVAETTKVTIYDADDLTLPMWMVFTGTSTDTPNYEYAFWTPSIGTHLVKAAKALNGSLFFAVSSGSGHPKNGLCTVDFVADNLSRNTTSLTTGGTGLPIIDRNAIKNLPARNTLSITTATPGYIALVALTNAPINPATGLPVVTVALGNWVDGSSSCVINDTGVVTYTQSVNKANVRFREDGTLLYVWAFNQTNVYIVPPAIYRSSNNFDTVVGVKGYIFDNGSTFHIYAEQKNFAWDKGGFSGGGTAVSYDYRLGFSRFVGGGNWTGTEVLPAYITSSFNTGYLPKNVKGAFLADINTNSLTSEQVLANPEFTTDLSNWTVNQNTAWVSGAMRLESNGDPDPNSYSEAFSVIPGDAYEIVMTLYNPDVVLRASYIRLSTNGTPGGAISPSYGSSGQGIAAGATQTITINTLVPAGVTSVRISTSLSVGANNAGAKIDVQSVYVRRVSPSRSVKSLGLNVTGLVNRAPVATGAQLVGYTGFTGSNYLEQAYSSALDFGTGDFCVMTWGTEFGTWRSIFSRVDSSTNAPLVVLEPSGTSNQARVFINSVQYIVNFPWFSGAWRHIVMARSNGVISLYLDGVLQSSFAAAGTVNGTLPIFRIAKHSSAQGSGAYSQGSLALFRIGATAPTTDQIKKIYEDELRMFQPGAACTLYGTSDAVTALAYDPKTNLLHVGTSAGRSVFDGLVRVANTTTPVTTVISAVNGLIAEQ